jgi:sigma-54 specific flagellar transcriptional regulator A
LFLDEVGELPLAMQVKLLRVLQERTYEPVGCNASRTANIRVVAATHRNLAQDVEAGKFRRDLYYRLFVCPVELPSLRERPQDIPVLFEHFWKERGQTRTVSADVMDLLARYAWPGNVREMENLVERMAVCIESTSITLQDMDIFPNLMHTQRETVLPPLAPPRPAPGAVLVDPAQSAAPLQDFQQELCDLLTRRGLPGHMQDLLSWFENFMLDQALNASQGNKRQAAQMLGLQRTTLVEKLRRRDRGGRDHETHPPDPNHPSDLPHAA